MSVNKHKCPHEGDELWRNNLREMREKKGMSFKAIAEKENLSEKSVIRVFSGEAKSPGVDLVRRIIHAMDGSFSEVFAESSAVIVCENVGALQADYDRLANELAQIKSLVELREAERDLGLAEIAQLKSELATEKQKNDLLTLKLQHKEEIIALHNYYNKLT